MQQMHFNSAKLISVRDGLEALCVEKKRVSAISVIRVMSGGRELNYAVRMIHLTVHVK